MGEPGPGVDKGGEILARTLILLSGGMDITIASTDLACSEKETLDVLSGARVRDVSGWAIAVEVRCKGRGGAAMVNC